VNLYQWWHTDEIHMFRCWRKARDLWREIGRVDQTAQYDRLLQLHGCGDN
jgi:hypothetical protein